MRIISSSSFSALLSSWSFKIIYCRFFICCSFVSHVTWQKQLKSSSLSSSWRFLTTTNVRNWWISRIRWSFVCFALNRMWWSFVNFSSLRSTTLNNRISINITMIFADAFDFENFFNKMIILTKKRDYEKTTAFEIWLVDFISSSRTNFSMTLKMFSCRCCSDAHLLCYKSFFNTITTNCSWWSKFLNITLRSVNRLYKDSMICRKSTDCWLVYRSITLLHFVIFATTIVRSSFIVITWTFFERKTQMWHRWWCHNKN